MSAQPTRPPRPPHPTLHELPEQTWLLLMAVIALLGLAAKNAMERHPFLPLVAGLVVGAAITTALRLRAHVLDRSAARTDPAAPGILIGTVKGDWRGARPRDYALPWRSFTRHVLVLGPTGSGKSYSIIQRVLRGHLQRSRSAVLYLDGKGDPIHEDRDGRPGVRFDHAFTPDDPERSARWNPLAGPDPDQAGIRFAAALIPDSPLAGDAFYRERGKLVLSLVIPAIAYTGYGLPHGTRWLDEADLSARLLALGMGEEEVESRVRVSAARVAEQLAWLPHRERQDLDALREYIDRDAKPSRAVYDTTTGATHRPATIDVVHRMLFRDGELERLLAALDTRAGEVSEPLASRLRHIHDELEFLPQMNKRERLEQLANLQNRLAIFLQPPFRELCCGRSDFTVDDVCHGASVAMLLNASKHPAAAPLGRVALGQFTQAVLSSTNRDLTKLAILDEFHHFVSDEFGDFLATARSFGGGALMALQSLAQIPDERLQRDILGNARTRIIHPGIAHEDARIMSLELTEHWAQRRSWTYAHAGERPAVGPAQPTLRVEHQLEARYSPTDLIELPARHAVIQLMDGEERLDPVTVNLDAGQRRSRRRWRWR